MKKIIILAFLTLFPQFSWSATMFDPDLVWRTIETTHFYIHYHQGEEEISQRTANIAEEVHSVLVPLMEWEPSGRTNIVLADNTDIANGFATTFPYNTIFVFIAPPLPESSIGDYDDWLRIVIIHEYTHILHIDQAHRIPKGLREVFGRFYFPNMLQPLWLIEGYATYQETSLTTGGRGRGSYFDMILRCATLEDRLNSIDQVSGQIATWPDGHFPYLYGVMFYQFLAEKYGEKKIANLSRSYSGRTIPFFINTNFKNVLGKDLYQLWREWEVEIRNRYEQQLKKIQEKGITPTVRLTQRGYYIRGPQYSPDGCVIAYSDNNAREYPSLRLINEDGTGNRKLLDRNSDITCSFSPDGKIVLFSQAELYRNFSSYGDLYNYNLGREKLKRLTYGQRLRYPEFSPNGQKILAVLNGNGQNNLVTTDPDGIEISYLTSSTDIQYSAPRWSPSGEKIAVSVWHPGGYQDIYIYHLEGNVPPRPERITHNQALDIFPTWSPDGKYILFSSDRSGVANLYAYRLDTKTFQQVTNLIGGAFESSISPDGKKIVFTGYSADGFDLYQIDFSPDKWWQVEFSTEPLDQPVKNKEITYTGRPYRPFSTLVPRFWVPLLGIDNQGIQAGLLTFNSDVINEHAYSVEFLYGVESQQPAYYLFYQNDQLLPSISIEYLDLPYLFGTYDLDGEEDEYWERRQKGLFSISIPIIYYRSSERLSFAYFWEELSAITDLPDYFSKPETGIFSGPRIGFSYSSARKYGFSISPEDGRSISLDYELLHESQGSDFNTEKVIADYREYLSLPFDNHVFALRLAGGAAFGDILTRRAFRLGGVSGAEALMGIEERNFYLRGYPEDALRGQRICLVSLEYRFPLRSHESGIGTLPFFFDKTHFRFFTDWGNAWDEDTGFNDFKIGVGAEFILDVTLGYYLPLSGRFGWARGLNEEGISKFYFQLGSSF
ncbi:MAG: PD40 domain-containing protein [Deltaproteobacteria bacterium]|nr:MAG: PD40 domain-containing protein [Deltaproteobacteria bacterium]